MKLENIEKSFGEKHVLRGVSLDFTGKTVALMGGSGTGKTTLLRIAAGIDKPDGGTVKYNGKIGVSFAEPRLFDNADVISNVMCVMTGKTAHRRARAAEILSHLGLYEALSLYPRDLSTGMAARVSLARLIAYEPDIYLMDEPFSALDEQTKSDVIKYVSDCTRGESVLFITHSADEAQQMNADVLSLAGGIIE